VASTQRKKVIILSTPWDVAIELKLLTKSEISSSKCFALLPARVYWRKGTPQRFYLSLRAHLSTATSIHSTLCNLHQVFHFQSGCQAHVTDEKAAWPKRSCRILSGTGPWRIHVHISLNISQVLATIFKIYFQACASFEMQRRRGIRMHLIGHTAMAEGSIRDAFLIANLYNSQERNGIQL
jgi:hypothetical protein